MKTLKSLTLAFAVAAVASPSAYAQLIGNGSFEQGTATVNATGAIDTTTIPDYRVYNVGSSYGYSVGFNVREDYANDGFGNQLVRIDVNNGVGGGTPSPVGAYGLDLGANNYIPVTAGTTYTIGFYAASLGGDGKFDVNIAGFQGAGGTSGSGAYNSDSLDKTFTISNTATTVGTTAQPATMYDGPYSGLQFYSLNYTPLAGTNSIDLDFVPGAGETAANAVVLDEITVSPVPEPRTWAMLLSGAAALLGLASYRRRGQGQI